MKLSEFCNSCHCTFVPGERHWRFKDTASMRVHPDEPIPVETIPHFCCSCAGRVGTGLMDEVEIGPSGFSHD
jgi:hypothetical protein